ncbi:hypothetical protein FGM00_03380 [Aggregatimonas sangjinii]|uniref:Cardiolipin synthase N-terminal domain-containing protein n=1 Tax=Aggregatimonas sangjinii TaxID=2583587 RepID=A0A5B7SRD9_9FLAO|nr:hypothetical protein [Aggregatimonas sangjinii]QCW99203.1 hypothetical protein FGM00_03380 [Aggregatimonas sangjinii]
MYLYLIIALQGYCVYHCLTNRSSYYWIVFIVFLPVLGALIYLLQDAFSNKAIVRPQARAVPVLKASKKITDLVEQFKFSETFENQSALGDAYLEAKMYDKAIENYKACLTGTFQNDFYVTSRLQEAYYNSSRIDEAIHYAEAIKDNPKFKKSRSAFLYALALEKKGELAKAERYLVTFDAPYNRYPERLELAEFYIRNAENEKAKIVLNEIIVESEALSKEGLKENRLTIKKVKELLKTRF